MITIKNSTTGKCIIDITGSFCTLQNENKTPNISHLNHNIAIISIFSVSMFVLTRIHSFRVADVQELYRLRLELCVCGNLKGHIADLDGLSLFNTHVAHHLRIKEEYNE